MNEDYRTEQEKDFMEIKETALAHRNLYKMIGTIGKEISDSLGIGVRNSER